MKAKEKIMIGINVIVLIFVTIALMFSTSMGETISFLNVGKQLAGGEELSFNLIASPEEARVKAGDTVTITLSVADISMGKTGLNSIVGNLEYDEDLFDEMTIEGNKNGEGQADWQIELNQIENHALYGKFCIYAIEEGVTENQDVVKMTLKLKSDLKPQTTEVKFLDLQSSDGNVAVDEQERIVKIIIYDEEPRPEQPEVLPEEPEKVPEGTVQTGDQVIVIAIIVIAVTILANILVFVKNKKVKTISIIVVILLGLLSTCITVFAKNIDQDIMDKISKNESWLNSEKYLVTDVDISRIAPNSKIEQIKNNFNKEIKIYESTKDEKNVENLSEKTTGTVTTGMLIKTADEENNYYVSVVGDLDRDGESNQVELTTIIRNTINSAKWGVTGIQAKSADMKLDGEIDDLIDNKEYLERLLDFYKTSSRPIAITKGERNSDFYVFLTKNNKEYFDNSEVNHEDYKNFYIKMTNKWISNILSLNKQHLCLFLKQNPFYQSNSQKLKQQNCLW